MSSSRPLGVPAVLALALATGAAPSARAAPADPPARDVEEMDVDELVRVRVSPFDLSTRLDRGYLAASSVSASRLDTPIRDLPFAIQAFTEEFVEDQKPVNVFDVARWSPGVTYRSNDFNEGNANVAIRGFAVGSLAGGNIQVLRDGFHGPSILDLTNVSRVEVVKGPSSFLYGQVAPGGIVNVITKSPQPEPAARAEARGGAYGAYRAEVDVTGPLARHAFARLAGSYDHDLRYWQAYDGRSWDVAPSLLWQPHPRVSLSLKYERFRKREDPPLMQKPGYNAQAGPAPTPSDPNLSGVDVPGLRDDWNGMSWADYRRSDTTGLSAWLDLRLGDHWSVRTAWAHQAWDVDMLFTGNLGMANNTTRLQGRRVRQQEYVNRDDAFEAQGAGRYDLGAASLRLLLGAEYVARRFDNRAAQAPNDPALGSDPIASPLPLWNLDDPSTWNRDLTVPLADLTANRFDQTVKYEDRSVYGGATVGLLRDRVLVLAGWRLTSTTSLLTDNLSGASQPRSTATKVTPQYGVLGRIAPGLALFASYSESFVPGTYVLNNSDLSKTPARPTEGRGADAGLKLEALDGRVSSTLTFFEVRNRNIVTDLSTTNASGTVAIYQAQGGEQRSRGLEWDATLAPAPGWQLYLSYSYMDARITEFSGRDGALLAQDPAGLDAAGRANYRNALRYHGAPLQMSAPHLANLWTRYDVQGGALRGLHVMGGVNYVRDQALLPDTPSWARQTYALVSAAAGYARAVGRVRLSLEVMGKNLAGERYRPSQSTRARPREVFATVAARL